MITRTSINSKQEKRKRTEGGRGGGLRSYLDN